MSQNNEFASYLRDNFYHEIFNALDEFIRENFEGLGIRTPTINNPTSARLEDYEIKSFCFKNDALLKFTIFVDAEIEIKGRTRYGFEDDSLNRWFMLHCCGSLENQLKDFSIDKVEEYSRDQFKREDVLSKFLVPYISKDDLDKYATLFLEKYFPQALSTPIPIDKNCIVEKMGLEVYCAPLTDTIFGQIYFRPQEALIFSDVTMRKTQVVTLNEGTILVNPDIYFDGNSGSGNNTVIHECVHWFLHKRMFDLQKIINPTITHIECETLAVINKDKSDFIEQLKYIEWQANALAPKILIPRNTGINKLREIINEVRKELPNSKKSELVEIIIRRFSTFFHVSNTAGKIRAIELGFINAIGIFNRVDGMIIPAYAFQKDAIRVGQTFCISFIDVVFMSITNPQFAEVLKDNCFVYVDGFVAINNEKYIRLEEGRKHLTEYALEHVDECCLLFDCNLKRKKGYDDSFYSFCSLCRDVDSSLFMETKYNRNVGTNEDKGKMAKELHRIFNHNKEINKLLDDYRNLSFGKTLEQHIKRKNITNETLAEYTGFSPVTISNYRTDKIKEYSIKGVLALCIGLNLHPSFSYDLLKKAGFVLIKDNELHCVYMYLIEYHHDENIMLWNEKLQILGFPIIQ